MHLTNENEGNILLVEYFITKVKQQQQLIKFKIKDEIIEIQVHFELNTPLASTKSYLTGSTHPE